LKFFDQFRTNVQNFLAKKINPAWNSVFVLCTLKNYYRYRVWFVLKILFGVADWVEAQGPSAPQRVQFAVQLSISSQASSPNSEAITAPNKNIEFEIRNNILDQHQGVSENSCWKFM